jgi:hypothetical protein
MPRPSDGEGEGSELIDIKDVGSNRFKRRTKKKRQAKQKHSRHWQDSNLRGRSPVAFKAIPLTTLAQCR